MRTPILWLEIPVKDFDRALNFYQNVFETKLGLRVFYGKRVGLFSQDSFGIKVSINEVENYSGTNGIKPFFFVNVMSDALELVEENGGEVIRRPILLKQTNENGELIIGSNLIDNEVGYYAEIKDSEGNHFYLYSHS